jgi:hypothetical protein
VYDSLVSPRPPAPVDGEHVNRFSHRHLSIEALRREIENDPAKEGEVTAMALARLAEYDARKLYLPDGFPSMLAYCMAELRLSEGEAK